MLLLFQHGWVAAQHNMHEEDGKVKIGMHTRVWGLAV